MQPERVALFDLDGSLADYDSRMRQELQTILAPGEVVPDNPWTAESYWERRMDLIKRQPGFWRNLEPIPLGVRVFALFCELDFRCMILTKGPRRTTAAWTEKLEWCQQHLPEASVTITEDKGLVYGKVLYDDWPAYIERWLQWRPRGLVFMRDTPYNRDFSHPQVCRLYDHGTAQDTRIQVLARLGVLND